MVKTTALSLLIITAIVAVTATYSPKLVFATDQLATNSGNPANSIAPGHQIPPGPSTNYK